MNRAADLDISQEVPMKRTSWLRYLAQPRGVPIRFKSTVALLIGLILCIGVLLASCSVWKDIKKNTNPEAPVVIYPPILDEKKTDTDKK